MKTKKFEQYDVVRVLEIRAAIGALDDAFNLRAPAIGDVATIIEVYTSPPGYELECSDGNGITQWLMAFSPEDVDLELVKQ
ncbi:hypothetical protein [Massilia eburnea]|uniref:hypothetical protein n=1 Tax=Massilia eburnea TaxID=1776165 RepID=UPI003D6ACDE2